MGRVTYLQMAEFFAKSSHPSVPQCVNIPPPQADLMLEDRAHMLTVSPSGTVSVIVR